MELKDLVEELAKALVNKPDEVSVEVLHSGHVTVYELKVAREDIGIVIGRGGRTATAMRTLLGSIAAKLKRNLVLDIAE
jgi:hypothetical protein